MSTLINYTATFLKVEDATRFAARIEEPGWNVVAPADGRLEWVEQKGRTVRWTGQQAPDLSVYGTIEDMASTVGYYGSTQRRKAKLRGEWTNAQGEELGFEVRAPFVW